MRLIVILCLLIAGFSEIKAQTGSISGSVLESGTRQPVGFATVGIKDSTTGTLTDENGRFRLEKLKPGLYNLQISSVGFQTKLLFEVEASNSKPTELEIELQPSSQELNELTVTANPFVRKEESPVSVRTIGVDEIQRYPGGNRDISQVIQSLPGVGFAASFRNDILIRGGGPSENRFYLDDIEIPNINHFATQGAGGGPVGLINVDFIREVNFYSGAFPANRGNMTSSLMDIRMRDGRDDRFGGTIRLGSSELSASMESPLNKKKTATVIASVRYSYLQFLFRLLKLPFLPTYSDAQFKVKWKITPKDELIVLSLGALDQFRLNLDANETEEQRYLLKVLPDQGQWNYAIGAKYTHLFNNSYLQVVASRNMLGNRFTKYTENDKNLPKVSDYKSTEAENKLRVEMSGRIKSWKYNYGISYEFARYYNRSEFPLALPGDTAPRLELYESTLNLHKYGIFATISRNFWDDRVTLSAGLRTDGNSYSKKMANILYQMSPRFSASVMVMPRWRINFNTGYYHQLPPYTGLGFRDRSGTLVNRDRLTYFRNVHVVLGTEYTTKWNSRFSVEGFFKQYYDVPFLLRDSISLFNQGSNFGVVGATELSSRGKGRTYGLELLYEQKLFKGWYGIVAYTLFWSEFQDKTDTYKPSSWDSRHVISLTGGKRFKRNWEIGARWRISGGQPFTPIDVQTSSLIPVWNSVGPILDYRRLNAERLPWFHLLDIRVTKRWYFKKWSFELYLDIQNVYAFKSTSAPDLTVVTNDANVPQIDPNDPSRYQTKFLQNRSGQPIPTLGFVVYY